MKRFFAKFWTVLSALASCYRLYRWFDWFRDHHEE
jgi:hypothetical protein